MDRPLWQILLAMLLVGLAVQRGAVGVVLHASELGPELPQILVLYALQTLAALATAVGMWLGRSWTVGCLLLLGASLAASSVLEAFWLGVRPPLAAVSEVLVVLLSTAALAWVLRREFDDGRRPEAPGGTPGPVDANR